MNKTHPPVSTRERQRSQALIAVLVTGWVGFVVAILVMRQADWGLAGILVAVPVALVYMILGVISVVTIAWGFFLLAQRKNAWGLGVTLIVLAAIPLLLSLGTMTDGGRSREWQKSRRPYRMANLNRHGEVEAALAKPITVVAVHEYGDCAVIEIDAGFGLVIDRRGADGEVQSLEEIRKQIAKAELHTQMPDRGSFYPMETDIPELVSKEIFCFACGVWAGNQMFAGGLCPP